MNLHVVTISLDSMPWITLIWPELRKLKLDWTWHVVEGVAAPEHCTSWCRRVPPRLSQDGTTEYLDSIAAVDSRVRLYRRAEWPGKVAMVNAPLKNIYENSILMQVDSDEVWTADQIETLVGMFKAKPKKDSARFYCVYHVGPDLVTTVRGAYGNKDYEWDRAWRFQPGQLFSSHEPPRLNGSGNNSFTREETESAGMVFQHYAWASEEQVRRKAEYYGGEGNPIGAKYKDAVEGWRRLQEHHQFPTQLQPFMPWVDDKAMVDRV